MICLTCLSSLWGIIPYHRTSTVPVNYESFRFTGGGKRSNIPSYPGASTFPSLLRFFLSSIVPSHACSIQYSIMGSPEGLPTCSSLVFGAANCSHLTSPTLSLVTSIKESCLHSDVLMLPLTWKFCGDGMLGGPTVYLFVSVLCRVSNFCLLMASVWNTAVSDTFLFAAYFC